VCVGALVALKKKGGFRPEHTAVVVDYPQEHWGVGRLANSYTKKNTTLPTQPPVTNIDAVPRDTQRGTTDAFTVQTLRKEDQLKSVEGDDFLKRAKYSQTEPATDHKRLQVTDLEEASAPKTAPLTKADNEIQAALAERVKTTHANSLVLSDNV
jgi:hypothetical protein